MGIFGVCLSCEVFNYSILALFVFTIFTRRVAHHGNDNVVTNVNNMMDFVKNGKRDKIIRIIALNKSLNTISIKQNMRIKKAVKLCEYVDGILEDGEYEKLNQITFSDLRMHCNEPDHANPFVDIWKDIKKELKTRKRILKRENLVFDILWRFGQLSLYICVVFIFGPIFLLSKLIQISYPWIIIGYLFAEGLLFQDQVDTFQIVMLGIYIGLQLVLLFLGIYIGRKQYMLWHVEPGNTWAHWRNIQTVEILTEAQTFYDECCWYPQVNKIVLSRFGGDIGNIIMDYCKNFKLNDESNLVSA